jgi:SAM-dependent methyltransferase
VTIRETARGAYLTAFRTVNRGDEHECPVCGATFKQFWSRGFGDKCPNCLSLERMRVLALYLRDRDLTGKRILHLAPEACLHDLFSAVPGAEYVTGDARPGPLVDVQLDARDLPFDDDAFDLIICNHVLEHIPEDTQVLDEFRRVLRPGGEALIQVPVDHRRETTYEDPTITDPADREREFGQFDHVRWYGRDIVSRYASTGFEVTLIPFDGFTTPEERDRWLLVDRSDVRSADILRCVA